MAGIEEVKTHVAACVAEVEHAAAAMRVVVGQLDDAIARLRIVTAGSLHPRASDAAVRLEQARERVSEAHSLALSGISAAQDYHGII